MKKYLNIEIIKMVKEKNKKYLLEYLIMFLMIIFLIISVINILDYFISYNKTFLEEFELIKEYEICSINCHNYATKVYDCKYYNTNYDFIETEKLINGITQNISNSNSKCSCIFYDCKYNISNIIKN